MVLDLFREWYKQDEDDDSLTSNKGGHDVGNEEQVDTRVYYQSMLSPSPLPM